MPTKKTVSTKTSKTAKTNGGETHQQAATDVLLTTNQGLDDKMADNLPFDVLDATKIIPEEVVPVEIVGKMVLDRNPENFFAETEQVTFCPSHVVPGIDFSEDPLLQGRLFSYLDTQLSRLGSPNFHQLPINASKCPFANM